MISHVTGDLFCSPAKVLVNTVNTVGVMGKGIALRFKQIYPEMFAQYQALCESGRLEVGNLWLYKTPNKHILNFPTKKHWRQPSKPEYIEAGLRKFVANYSAQGITSIAFPRLGCGNGELDWDRTVQPLMERYLDRLPIDIFVYAFEAGSGASAEHKNIDEVRDWLRSEPRTLAFSEAWDDLVHAVGAGRPLETWTQKEPFKASIALSPDPGIRIHTGAQGGLSSIRQTIAARLRVPWIVKILAPDLLFIPRDAVLGLWQSIRSYGFCVPHIMPEQLDLVAEYIMPVMALLRYLKPVKIAQPTARDLPKTQVALQLFEASAVAAVPTRRQLALPA